MLYMFIIKNVLVGAGEIYLENTLAEFLNAAYLIKDNFF
ncbi:Uncharacterized protein YR821_3096 [Yersinia ruckeri]|nr:hypothetical protein yruck0001_1890 [Yersinia ruckeri ATCC 29473]QTD78012.1 Uncharacterized protein YR821_3096 [Yersinia ruckeri]